MDIARNYLDVVTGLKRGDKDRWTGIETAFTSCESNRILAHRWFYHYTSVALVKMVGRRYLNQIAMFE
jgi:hypothetical protein